MHLTFLVGSPSKTLVSHRFLPEISARQQPLTQEIKPNGSYYHRCMSITMCSVLVPNSWLSNLAHIRPFDPTLSSCSFAGRDSQRKETHFLHGTLLCLSDRE